MTAASLSLLKGAKKPETADAVVAAEVSVELEDSIELNPDTMTEAEIDEVVGQLDVTVPENFMSMSLVEKREWLKAQGEATDPPFDTTETANTAASQPAADVKQTETAPAPAAEETPKKKKNAKAKANKDDAVDVESSVLELKPKKTGSTVSTSVAKEGEIVADDDVIINISHEIENLSKEGARTIVASLADQTEKTFFKLGGVLSVIQANSWFEPYGTFRDYVEKEHGLAYRRAMYWIAIYNGLVASGVPWVKVKDLGWTKLKLLAEIITPENVDQWVATAKSQTVINLMETIKNTKEAANKSLTDETPAAQTATTKTFKVHPGQKETIEAAITKAKEDGGTTVDTVALEYICLDYMAKPTLVQRLKDLGIEPALEALGKAFPDANFVVEMG